MENFNNFISKFIKDNSGQLNILGKLGKITIIFIIISIVNKLINKAIDKTINNKRKTDLLIDYKRANTLITVLKKIIKYILIFIGIIISLDMFNIKTTSILATAGIGGLAIGFGAQSLVKDVITGFFILLEDQYSVGDLVETEGFEGIVEDIGLRVTKLRAFSGELHIIPNGNIQIVTNKTRGSMRALVTVTISYEEDIDRAVKALEKVCEEIKSSNQSIVEGPTVLGVTEFGEYGIVLSIVAKTQAMEQWAVERHIRKKAKEALQKENIKMPYPKRVIIGGENK